MKVIVSTFELQKAFATTRSSNLKKILSKNKVRYFEDRMGNPFTTLEAMNAALGLSKTDADSTGFIVEHLRK